MYPTGLRFSFEFTQGQISDPGVVVSDTMCFILHGTSIHLTKCAATELADGTVIYQAKAGSRGRASRAIFRQIRSRSKAEVEKAERATRPPVA
ncbi:unnamed protein product [Lampetra planeri]